jgi:hypothetical protein
MESKKTGKIIPNGEAVAGCDYSKNKSWNDFAGPLTI